MIGIFDDPDDIVRPPTIPPAPIVLASGRRAWLIEGPCRDIPDHDVWQPIASSLAASGSRPRLASGDGAMTGPELLGGVAKLAARVPAEAWVGVHVARSAAMVQAVLAVWSRGSAYIPMASEHPPARTAGIVDGCRPEAIITDQQTSEFDGYDTISSQVVAGRALFVHLRTPAAAAPRPARCCTIAHTSGTSGAPKGVMISHRALLNRLSSLRGLAAPGPDDRILFKTSLAFDVHVWEFVLPLVSGGVLVIYDQDSVFDPRAVGALMAREGVTIAGFVPSLLSAILDRRDVVDAGRLRLVFCGGENWTGALARKFRERLPRCVLRNSYGPAETTLAVANWLVPNDPPPAQIEIGAPLDNTIFLIEELDDRGGLVTGPLDIGGAQVSDGYVSRPADDRFFALTVGDRHIRFYRTGDLVELDPATGCLVFKGRADHQVKLGGVRIELGEVEAAILSIDEVEQCAVVLLDKATPCLLATYRTTEGVTLDPEHVRRRCRALLPATAIPAYVRQVAIYPLNASGKIDRAALARDG